MELEHFHKIALIGFIGAVAFGAIVNRTNFSALEAIRDWINKGSLTRFRVYFLSMGLALVITQSMYLLGWIDISQSIYLTTDFTWLGYILGGLMLGIGMTIGSGCGQGVLVRLGGGSIKSLVVLLVMGLTAYMTLRGIFALIRLNINNLSTIDLSDTGLSSQGIPELLFKLTSLPPTSGGIILTIIIGGGAILFALMDRRVWTLADNLLAGLGVGLLIAGAWYTTGVIGYDDFEPIPLESVSYISSIGNTITYLMTFTGATINFGIAVVLGTVLGSFLYSIFTGTFRLEGFNSQADLINHICGAFLVGFGGVLSLGCTTSQGLSGMSTLAMGSVLALGSIIVGCVFTLKIQYHLLDELGFRHAFRATVKELTGVKQE